MADIAPVHYNYKDGWTACGRGIRANKLKSTKSLGKVTCSQCKQIKKNEHQ